MHNPRIALVLAPSEHTLYTRMNLPPLSLGVLRSYLQSVNVEVELFDLNNDFGNLFQAGRFTKTDLQPFYDKRSIIEYIQTGENGFFTSFIDTLLADKHLDQYDIIGVSCGADFSWLEIHSGFAIAKHIRKHYGKPVIIGGNNLDYLIQFKEAFKSLWVAALSNFPFIIPGPGEIVLRKIVHKLSENPAWQPKNDDMLGLVYLNDNQIVQSPNAKRLIVRPDYGNLLMEPYYNYVRDSQRYPRPEDAKRWNLVQIFKWPSYISWHANNVFARHKGNGIVEKLIIPYVFNYNCPYECAFCTESLLRRKVVHATADQALEDLLILMEKYSTNYFFFFNNYFNLSKRFVREFSRQVINQGVELYWSDCARFNNLDFDTLKAMKEAGCTKLTFGLETASPKVLSVIDKRVKLDQAERVLTWCKELGIWADLEIIVGMPHEYEEDFQATYDFLQRNNDAINFFNINRYFVVPRSLMGAYPDQYGMELILEPDIYEKLLYTNFRWLCSDKDLSYRPENFRVYKFNEIGGRNYEKIAEAVNKKVSALNGIQRNEFIEAWHMLNIIEGKLASAMSH